MKRPDGNEGELARIFCEEGLLRYLECYMQDLERYCDWLEGLISERSEERDTDG